MNIVRLAIRQPVTVAVGVLLALLAGVLALRRIPIQLTPNVEDTIVAVTTFWEGASPEEMEQEVVDEQEERLQGIANLRQMTSVSQQGQAVIRLEFIVGTDKESALREVGDKLREVPSYPAGVDEPVVSAKDPETRDFIAWIVFSCDDPAVDVRTLNDFVADRVEPVLERVEGVSEINVLGGREREVQVRVDQERLAQRGIGVAQLVDALRRANRNASAGQLREDKADVRLRLVNQFTDVHEVERTVVTSTSQGTVLVGDVAEVVETFKEARSFVRSRGQNVIAINAQREVGANVMQVMAGLQVAIAGLNAPGGVLDTEARQLGTDGQLRLTQVYDQTIYIDDALALVRSNIWIGGALAIAVLLLFLRSLRSAGIVALAIPISVVGAVVSMVALGRSINVISLAGMAFAVGMVVDNAIVVLENIHRHMELGKPRAQAAFDGTREVLGAIVAATLTTVAVFVPILLIQEEAGQLFRDIALAIVAAVTLSLIVSVTVIPSAAARLMKLKHAATGRDESGGRVAGWISRGVRALCGSVIARVAIVALMTAASVWGSWALLPPTDYLPTGNRNLVFGLLIPPPGYSLEQREALGARIEAWMRPYWEAGELAPGSPESERAVAALPEVPTVNPFTRQPGPPVTPPPLENYFLVSFDEILFHGGVSMDPERVVDMRALMEYATRQDVVPGVYAFAFQVPLFQLGGSSGSAVKINFTGDDLQQVSSSALAVFMQMMGRYGPGAVQPDPGNFNVPTPELQVVPDQQRLIEVGLSPAELGVAVQALGDGAIIGDYRQRGDTIDLKVIAKEALEAGFIADLGEQPVATPGGSVVPLRSLARLVRVNAPPQINHAARQRSVTLQFTPPAGMPLEQAIADVASMIAAQRAAGVVPPEVGTSWTGSAAKLDAVQRAMLGDGTVIGTVSSSLVLALIVVYLLMCVLFQSFVRPLVILFSVPLATLGGFAALAAVHYWSLVDRYMPTQNLDVLTMLGFVILIGVVVNNAILIVHQSINLMRGEDEAPMAPRDAIAEAVRTRVRPIFMSTLTSVGGMAPLVLMPGSGSELYRGLGSVVVGGLMVSTVFTLVLVPLLFSLVTDLQAKLGVLAEAPGRAPVTGGGVQARTALLSLLVVGLFLSTGCVHTKGYDPVQPAAEAEAVDGDQVTALGDTHPAPQVVEAPTSPIMESLEARLPELEQIGGPQAYEGIRPAYPGDLTGKAQRTRQLGLWSAITAAVENNLGLRLTSMTPEIAQEDVTIAEAFFNPSVFSGFEYGDRYNLNQVPVINQTPLGAAVSTRSQGALRAGVGQRLLTGATVSAATFLTQEDDSSPGIDFSPNPAWRSGLTLGVTQPLMRGFGANVNRADIELSRNQYQRTVHDVRAELLLVVAETQAAYWDLAEAWRRLRILERLTEQGTEVERVLSERRLFDAELAQFSDAQATVERRRANLVRAERLVKAASDRLKLLIYSDVYPPGGEVLLETAHEFDLAPIEYELAGAVERALERRPEIQAALLGIEDAHLRQRVADNQLQPQVDLSAEFEVAGLGDDLGNAYDSALGGEGYRYLLGLSFEIPIGNHAARSRVRQARAEGRLSVLRYERTVQQVVYDVKQALRDLRTSYSLIAATRATRVAESENLRALLLEYESRGKLSPELLNLLFQRQERLSGAQLEEVEAQASYCRARAAFERAIGSGPELALLQPGGATGAGSPSGGAGAEGAGDAAAPDGDAEAPAPADRG